MALLRTVIITRMLPILFFIIHTNKVTGKYKEEEKEEEEEDEEISFLSELPLQQLLSQKNLPKEFLQEQQQQQPVALSLIGESKPKMIGVKGIRNMPIRKTFHEEDDDDKEWVHKKPEKNHSHDILNTSLTVLSYLAFGGYLLCMIVNSLRQNTRSQMVYPSVPGSLAPSPSMTALLQQYGTRKPIRIKFPAVTVHQGRKKGANDQIFFIKQ